MRIGIDAGCLGVADKRLKVGVYSVTTNILTELSKIDNKNTYLLYSFKSINKKFISSLGDKFQNIVVRPSIGWATLWLPLQARRDKLDIFIGINQYMPSLPNSTWKIGFIYDLAFLNYPDFYKGSYNKIAKNTENLFRESDEIVTISSTVKKEIEKNFLNKKKKIHILYPGTNVNVKSKKSKDFLLYVGSLKKGKNIPNIIRAFDLFVKKTRKETRLIIVGGDPWRDKEIDSIYKTLPNSTKKKINFKGHISNKQLENLYSEALVFISPSYYEGFGITHVEAMSAGLPVIASNRGAMREVIGDGGIFVNPEDPTAIYEAIHNLLTNKTLYKHISAEGLKKSKKYSWKKSSALLLDLINQHDKT